MDSLPSVDVAPIVSDTTYSLRLTALWWIGGACLVALVIYGSLATGGPVLPVTFSDKLQHLVSYGVLGVYFGGVVKHRAFLSVLLMLLAMSVGLEFLQEAGGQRQFDLVDMVFNAVGLALGGVLCRFGLGGWCRVVERWVLA